MMDQRQLRTSLRRGFTLLEILVVIMIIGILSSYLVVNVPEWIDNANQTACQQNMRRNYGLLQAWRSDHSMSWPRDEGQRFFLRLWKDDSVEHTEKNVKLFFCPSEPYGEILAPGEDVFAYLDDWDAIGPGYTSYAGFTTNGDRQVRRKLNKSPGHTVIMSDAHMTHRTALVYLTGDGGLHKLLKSDMEEEYGIDLDQEDIEVGPGCVIEDLWTVSND